MNHHGQPGDGDYRLPIASISRKSDIKILCDALSTIRREGGVDPKRYDCVASDIRYDAQHTMFCADITAQTTADLLRPAILFGHSPGGWRRTKALLRHPLTAAAIIIIAGKIYLDSRTFEKTTAKRQFEAVIGRAILAQRPEIKTTMNAKDLSITISGNLLNGADATLTLKHELTEEVFLRLRQEYKDSKVSN